MDRLVIDITDEDISEGDPNNSFGCPIALAARRALGLERVSIGITRLVINEPGYPLSIRLPDELIRFVSRFDGGHAVSPLRVELEVPHLPAPPSRI